VLCRGVTYAVGYPSLLYSMTYLRYNSDVARFGTFRQSSLATDVTTALLNGV
jgi:hypothetical protein